MKKIIIYFCIAFTAIVLLTSFSYNKIGKVGGGFLEEDNVRVYVVSYDGAKYLVACTNEGGVGICKK